MYQMPRQDISKDFCKFLCGEASERRYTKFVEDRNFYALDIGICYKNESHDTVTIPAFRNMRN
jgi:hypothetical protein